MLRYVLWPWSTGHAFLLGSCRSLGHSEAPGRKDIHTSRLGENFTSFAAPKLLPVQTMVVNIFDDRVRHNISERQIPLPHQPNLGARNIVLRNKRVSTSTSEMGSR